MKDHLLAQIAPSLLSGNSRLRRSAESDVRASTGRSASLGSSAVLSVRPQRLKCLTLAALEDKWRAMLDSYEAAKLARIGHRESAIEANLVAARDALCHISLLIDEHQWEHGCGLIVRNGGRPRKAPAAFTGASGAAQVLREAGVH